MKRFILACGFVLISTSSAMAALYNNKTTADAGNANSGFTPSVAWTTSIPGGSIATDDAMVIFISAYASGTYGYMEVKLNGQSLGFIDVPVGALVEVEMRVTRDTTSNAFVTGTVSDSTQGVYDWNQILGPVNYAIGLAFTSAQNLTIELSNSVAGGTHLQYAGVER
jgi:hypothetical protein